MSEHEQLLSFTQQSMLLVLMLPLPVLSAAVIVGLLIGLFQALTQIQDQTFSFAFKLIAVIVAMALTASAASNQLLNFMNTIFDYIPRLN